MICNLHTKGYVFKMMSNCPFSHQTQPCNTDCRMISLCCATLTIFSANRTKPNDENELPCILHRSPHHNGTQRPRPHRLCTEGLLVYTDDTQPFTNLVFTTVSSGIRNVQCTQPVTYKTSQIGKYWTITLTM